MIFTKNRIYFRDFFWSFQFLLYALILISHDFLYQHHLHFYLNRQSLVANLKSQTSPTHLLSLPHVHYLKFIY